MCRSKMRNGQAETQRDTVLWTYSGRDTLRPGQIRPGDQTWRNGDKVSRQGQTQWASHTQNQVGSQPETITHMKTQTERVTWTLRQKESDQEAQEE